MPQDWGGGMGAKGFHRWIWGGVGGCAMLTWAQPGDPRGRALGWHSVCVRFEETHE